MVLFKGIVVERNGGGNTRCKMRVELVSMITETQISYVIFALALAEKEGSLYEWT